VEKKAFAGISTVGKRLGNHELQASYTGWLQITTPEGPKIFSDEMFSQIFHKSLEEQIRLRRLRGISRIQKLRLERREAESPAHIGESG
jgi:hypothetical protein